MKTIYDLAQEAANNYRNESSRMDITEGLPFHMYEEVRTAEFLTNARYITGDYDENGDLKPFHDVITRLLENQRSAEEVDLADLEMTTDDSDYYTRATLVTKYHRDWGHRHNLGKFLNDAIETRGKYGGVLVKVVESDDDINLEVVDWNSFNGDPMDLKSGLKVINHFYTPSQLIEVAKEHGWDMEKVTEAIELYAEADISEGYQEQKETQGNYILVREVTGDLSETFIKEDGDEHTYVYQIHYLAGTEITNDDGESKGLTLFSEELTESPYYYLPYKKRSGNERLLGIGVVERAKHAQVQLNRAAQQYKRAMDFASTHVLQSSSKNLKGKNVLTQLKSGAIIQHDDNRPVTGVNMAPSALAHLDRYMNQWQTQVDRATGTYSVSTGENLPSGTPYRLGAILDQNAQSAFDLRREEFDIFMNNIYTERLIPFFIKEIKKLKVLKLKFNPEEIRKLDEDVENYRADEEIMSNYFSGAYDNLPPMMKFVAMGEDKQFIMQGLDQQLKKQKSRRNITDFPSGYWDDVANKLYVTITNERRKKGIVAESINNVLMQYLQFKPQLDQDPEARQLFNNLVEVAGLDPIDWSNSTPAQPEQPVQGQAPQKKSAIDSPEELTAKPQ